MHDDEAQNADLKKKLQDTWYEGNNNHERWMIATMGFGQGIDFPTVRYVIHYDVHGLMHFVQKSGCGGRDGSPCESHVFYTELLSTTANSDQIDHIGIGDMNTFLQTSVCRRLALYAVDGIAHSCASLMDAHLYDQCQKVAKVRYIISVMKL